MRQVTVHGGLPLEGIYRPSGNKNSALPLISASLLTQGTTKLLNIPKTSDVRYYIRQVEKLGYQIDFKDGQVDITSSKPLKNLIGNPLKISPQLASVLSIPLLENFGKVIVNPLNPRNERLNTHLHVFEDFGVYVYMEKDSLILERAKRIEAASVLLDETSVTATEVAILLAVKAQGKSIIQNAASEPHIVELSEFLNLCGAKIEGIGTNYLTIEGVESLVDCKYRIASDHIEIASVLAMAALTRGSIEIVDVNTENLKPILKVLNRFNIKPKIEENNILYTFKEELVVSSKFSNQIVIKSSPWPGCPTDLLPIIVVLATQTRGSVLFHESMYDSRMYFVDELNAMGANLVQCDPHRVLVVGPSTLYPTIMESPDVRTGLALLSAALIAPGRTKIRGSDKINRIFYEPIKKLKSIGAKILEE